MMVGEEVVDCQTWVVEVEANPSLEGVVVVGRRMLVEVVGDLEGPRKVPLGEEVEVEVYSMEVEEAQKLEVKSNCCKCPRLKDMILGPVEAEVEVQGRVELGLQLEKARK